MRKLKQTSQTWLAALMALGLSLNLVLADTFVSGNVSGTWTKAGSRYIVTGNLTVPSGQTLTIQPGVEVVIGQGLRIDVLGRILAEGTAAERITFRGANASLYWDTIAVSYSSLGNSSFVNCRISDATNAIRFSLSSYSTTWSPQILNCAFSNCVSTCLYQQSGGTRSSPVMAGLIANCRFESSSNGIHLLVNDFMYGAGAMNTMVVNNVFKSLSGAAVRFEISAASPSNPRVANNVFVQCATGVRKTGSSAVFNDEVAHNLFFNNQTNFVGYPAGVHGTICCVNANGTPCDLLYNIFTDPLFCETTNYTLSATSPCIDAGNPAGAYLDNCLTNACQKGSLGTTVNDIGIWGGPGACAPAGTTFELSARAYPGVTIHPSTPGQYRLEYRTNVDSGPWTQATNVNLLSTPWTYIDWDSPGIDQRFYRAVKLP